MATSTPTSTPNSILAPGIAVLLLTFTGPSPPAEGQWTNRYPKVEDYSHHVYLEGYELPTMNAGPTAPAVSPGGARIAFSARGWIWVLDLATGKATRITSGAAMDFRPAWSPDGRRLAFVRDDGRDTWIVVRDLDSGRERAVDTPAIELDPTFGPGGDLYYSSASGGAFDVWRVKGSEPEDGEDGRRAGERITERSGIEVRPTVSADQSVLVYLHKGGGDRVVARDLETHEERTLVTERILSQTRPAVRPDGREVAYNWPTQDGYELRLLAVDAPETTLRLTSGERGLPLSPAWTPDGEAIVYVEAGRDEVMRLYRIPRSGGEADEIPVRIWEWGEETGTLRIVTRSPRSSGPLTSARLSVVDRTGHPAVPSEGYAQFGLQDGRVFFYSAGTIEVTVPAGTATVRAVRGLTTPEVVREIEVPPGGVAEVSLVLEEVWDARAAGYLSGDHHFHLNYGGPFSLDPEDLVGMMEGEGLDVATPLLANLHNRFEDQHLWGWTRGGGPPMIRFGQEVRSHFLGHVGLLETETLSWPWIWGPGYQVYGRDDRPNGEPLGHARREGGLGGYVHPVSARDPFAPEHHGSPPVMLAVDGILGTMDWLELACLWTDELGTAELWYRFLNLGVPIAPEAGTDVMNDFYRTMPIGTTRLYVRTEGATSADAYFDAFRRGRSFVTTGPILEFELDGVVPGEVAEGGGSVPFEVRLASAVAVDTVEVLVNGEVVWSGGGVDESGTVVHDGTVEVPEGGWVAARAHGGEPTWPAMNPLVFAHTGPVWLGAVGSVHPEAARRSARELRPLVDAAEARLREAYGETPTPRILDAFGAARRRLDEAEGG